MSDNQKPSRDTGEEVCLTCGREADDWTHLAPGTPGAAPANQLHAFRPMPVCPDSNDTGYWYSGQTGPYTCKHLNRKPAPKAPVSHDAEGVPLWRVGDPSQCITESPTEVWCGDRLVMRGNHNFPRLAAEDAAEVVRLHNAALAATAGNEKKEEL